MTTRRATLEYVAACPLCDHEHICELVVDIMSEPTRWHLPGGDPGYPGYDDVEPVSLHVDGHELDLRNHAALVDTIIDIAEYPAEELDGI